MGDARRASVAVREGRERGCWCYNRVRLPHATTYASPSLTLPRVVRQPGQPLAITEGSGAAGQPQNALAITIPSQSTPTDLTPSALVAPGSLPISSLPARPNLPDDPVIPHNGFATAEEGEKAFFHLLRKAGVDASWTWDQTMRTIITDPLYKALNTLAEKKAAWQKVITLNRAFLRLMFLLIMGWFFTVYRRLEG